jgi:hypothetical protein
MVQQLQLQDHQQLTLEVEVEVLVLVCQVGLAFLQVILLVKVVQEEGLLQVLIQLKMPQQQQVTLAVAVVVELLTVVILEMAVQE